MLKLRLLVFIFLTSLSIKAQTAPIVKSHTSQIINGNTFIIHTVKSGQTLYAISKAYNVSVDELKAVNNTSGGLKLNQKLKIPYKTEKHSPKFHVVKAGETLYSISRRYDIDVNTLKQANPSTANGLKVGQRLQLTTTAEKPKGKSTGQYFPPKSSTKKFKTHTVKAGETLYSISRKYKIPPSELLKYNPTIANGLKIGQEIKIPTEETSSEESENTPKKSTVKVVINGRNFLLHRVQKGETPYSIAKLYDLHVGVIFKENPEIKEGIQLGQKIKIPAEKTISVSNFVFHTVNKGETLYSISKQYSVSTGDLLDNNPALQNGLKTKMVLKIPANSTNIEVANQNVKRNIIYHVVAEGETLYSISGKYQCPVKEVKKLNPSVDINSLRLGTVLKVRVDQQRYWQYTVQAEEFQNDSTPVSDSLNLIFNCDSIEKYTETINIAFFAPFYSTANDTMDLSDKISRGRERIYKRSIMYIHFYQGVLMALEELKEKGFKINMNVFDTEGDTTKVKSMLKQISKENTDIIIGPFSNRNFKIVSEKANQEQILIISPLSPHPSILKDQPYTILANTPQKYRTESSALYVSQYNDYNYIIIHNNHIKELDMIENFKEILLSNQTDSSYFSSVVMKEINFKKDGITAIEDAVSVTTKNVIYIPSDDPAFVNDILTRLYRFIDKYEVEVHGLAQWERFKNVELEYLYKLNFHFTTSNYRDYEREDIKNFIKKYRINFSTEPSKFVFQGRDIVVFAANAVQQYGKESCNCIENYNFEGLHTSISLKRYGENKGLSNTSIYLLEYTSAYSRELIEFDSKLAKEMLKDIKTDDTDLKYFAPNEDDNWDY